MNLKCLVFLAFASPLVCQSVELKEREAFKKPSKEELKRIPSKKPLLYGVVSQQYGFYFDKSNKPQMNKGLKYSCKIGAPVVAAAEGTISKYDKSTKTLTIRHSEDFRTIYSPITLLKAMDKPVKTGEVVGTTLMQTFEYKVLVKTVPVDPATFILNETSSEFIIQEEK